MSRMSRIIPGWVDIVIDDEDCWDRAYLPYENEPTRQTGSSLPAPDYHVTRRDIDLMKRILKQTEPETEDEDEFEEALSEIEGDSNGGTRMSTPTKAEV